LCDADEESSSDILSEELDIDNNGEFNSEIEGETMSEESSNEMSESESESGTSVVVCWWVDNDARGEMLPNKAIGL
jgi:hypothetical protein